MDCEREMLRSLGESDRYGSLWLKLKAINDKQYGPVARVRNREDQALNDAMGAWKWHAENVRVQAAAITALVAVQGYQVSEYERVRDAQRRNDPEVHRQRSADNLGSVGAIAV